MEAPLIGKVNSFLLKAAVVIGAIVTIAGGYSWYLNAIWEPTITVTSVDYDKAVAQITMNGKPVVIQGDSTFCAGGDWGVRFGTSETGGTSRYNRLEVVKSNLVKWVIS